MDEHINLDFELFLSLTNRIRLQSIEIQKLKIEVKEARKWAYSQRLKKYRSGCACHLSEDGEEIIRMCALHKHLIKHG